MGSLQGCGSTQTVDQYTMPILKRKQYADQIRHCSSSISLGGEGPDQSEKGSYMSRFVLKLFHPSVIGASFGSLSQLRYSDRLRCLGQVCSQSELVCIAS